MIRNKKWGTFLLGDEKVFTLHSTLNGIDKNKLIDDGEKIFPYITRSKSNNGLDMFVSKQSYPINKGNVIIIGLDTQTVFYQEADFYTGQNVQLLYNEYLNKNVAMFLIPIIKKQLEVLNWGGNGATLGRLKKKRVSLPITDLGFPDWNFMGEYVQNKLNKINNNYQLPKQHIITDFRELDEVEWGEYFLTDIFETIKRGKRLKKSDHISGNIPYISSTKMNNGCYGFLGNQKGVRKFRNCLTIANSGSVGSVFYHDYQFIASDHVTALVNSKLTKQQYLFIASRMSKIGEKYSFNREINDERIQREKIQLPVGINGQPDYDYMEQYMKRMENKVIKKIGMS